MAKIKLGKQLLAVTENKVGMLAQVCADVSGTGVNIQAVSAYGLGDKANFRLLTDNNQKAKEVLQAKGHQVSEQDVVLLELPNKVGALKEAGEKLKGAGVDLKYIYGTTCSGDCDCLLVFDSNNNARAEEVLKD